MLYEVITETRSKAKKSVENRTVEDETDEIVELTVERQAIDTLVGRFLERLKKDPVDLTYSECGALFKKIAHMSTFP